MIDPARRDFLARLFHAAILRADAKLVLKDALPEKPQGRVVVVGAGKGAAPLAAAFEELWDGTLEGVVVTRYGYGRPCRFINVLEASHPIPDKAGLRASRALFDAVSDLGADDLVVALISGGGSALLPAPPNGLTLYDEQALNKTLLASGAPIGVMNAIRKHTSGIKGGRLAAAAYPAQVVSLIVSDVPGDDPAQVASGPTVPDPVSLAETRAMIQARNLLLPPRILSHLNTDNAAAPHPADPVFRRNEVRIVASAGLSLRAAAQAARAAGMQAVVLSDAIEGEARDAGLFHAAIARQVLLRDQPFQKPVVILSGGETTVTLGAGGKANGRGGRNSEFLLSFATAIDGNPAITALAADTDGIDGSEDNAGAFADTSTITRLNDLGIDGFAMLSEHNAWVAFDALDDLFVTGPTGTNVNDFRAILVGELPDQA